MQRPPDRPAWLTRAATIGRSDTAFRISLFVLAAVLMLLLQARMY
jgi:hypothetical protein